MKLKITDVAHHRNGISGEPFCVFMFNDTGNDGRCMVAIVFEADGHCAVLDVAKLAAGDIAFGSNSWRGDRYEPWLRQAIQQSKGGEQPCRHYIHEHNDEQQDERRTTP